MKLGVIFLVILVVILLYVVYQFSSGSATNLVKDVSDAQTQLMPMIYQQETQEVILHTQSGFILMTGM